MRACSSRLRTEPTTTSHGPGRPREQRAGRRSLQAPGPRWPARRVNSSPHYRTQEGTGPPSSPRLAHAWTCSRPRRAGGGESDPGALELGGLAARARLRGPSSRRPRAAGVAGRDRARPQPRPFRGGVTSPAPPSEVRLPYPGRPRGRRGWPAAAHSLRSAAAVSTRVARRAGRSLASVPAASSPIRPAVSVAASWGAMP